MKETPKSRSGAQWSDKDYEAHGYRRLGVRLKAATLARLDRLAKAEGLSRTKLLEWLIAHYIG